MPTSLWRICIDVKELVERLLRFPRGRTVEMWSRPGDQLLQCRWEDAEVRRGGARSLPVISGSQALAAAVLDAAGYRAILHIQSDFCPVAIGVPHGLVSILTSYRHIRRHEETQTRLEEVDRLRKEPGRASTVVRSRHPKTRS